MLRGSSAAELTWKSVSMAVVTFPKLAGSLAPNISTPSTAKMYTTSTSNSRMYLARMRGARHGRRGRDEREQPHAHPYEETCG